MATSSINVSIGLLNDSLPESLTSRSLKLTFYAIIFVTSLVGNTLVCLVVCRQQRLRTSTNYYIVNLACADLAVTVICIPFDVILQEHDYVWPFGQFLCRILYPLMTMSTFASVGTLTAIALNRYTAVSRAMRVRASKKVARIAIAVIWFFSFLAVLPYILVLNVNKDSVCVELWSPIWRKSYTVFIFVFQYVIPLTIITIAYIMIGILLHKNRSNLTAAHRRQDKDVAKVSRMMVIVVVIFAVTLLPNHILWLQGEFGDSNGDQTRRSFLHWGALLIYANSCTNPIVYSICIEEFRMAFKAYITKCCRVTDEDIRPVNRMFERISFRGKSFSSDRLLGRQISRRGIKSTATSSFEDKKKGKLLRHVSSQTTFRDSELAPVLSELKWQNTLDDKGHVVERQENKNERKKAFIKLSNSITHKTTRV